ncbi:transcription termination/antitermination NusG family protein [Rhizobium sp. LC145]|uniref:transcription termination/antitermination protein NusG n=1 Tax=Rhizobium sp. LC145 TaxID=1120688 RepID=UPI00062A33B7|nr:transcription termination/antitermination NusG family protein [Rhizobium sp. LC145]KKX28238.1 antitermination protein NusG [Rhizobium sp. LC145]TKT58342.1 antitermination protein NusG [Rhizobiaceae bacterium LC148]
MMQHKNISGAPIAAYAGERFVDRMRRINVDLLEEAALVVLNCRINGGRAPWFALRVWTGREKAVENNLEEMGIRSLVPMRKGPDLRRRHRVIEGTMMPVIHGYVLVQMLARAEYLAGLQAVEHAIEVLGGCEKPMWISSAEVNRFNALAHSGAYDAERPVELEVQAGEPVFITAGHFCDQKAIVVTPNRRGRGDVVVAIKFMGREVPVTVPLALLQKL